MGQDNALSNINISFKVFMCMGGLFIIIVALLLFITSHGDNECRHSRSDGKTVKFCYNDNLYCAIADPDQKVASGSISLRQTTEDTLSFGTQFSIGLCYGSCVPETSDCISFGSDELGYCTNSNTVYLKGAVGESNFPTITRNLLASLIEVIPDTGIETRSFSDNEIIFVSNGIKPGINTLTSSSGENGIFGVSTIDFEIKQKENFFQPANENLLNVNKRLKNLNAFRKIDSPTVAEGISQTWACVDPGFIFPCNGRIFDGVSLYCYPNGSSCVKFCSHGYYDTTYETLTQSGNCAGVKNLDNNAGYYQTTGFGTNLENSSYKANADPENKYSKGSVENPGNFSPNQQISRDNLANNYLQDRVFCAGTAPGICNVASGPINSAYPTPSARGQYTIGF